MGETFRGERWYSKEGAAFSQEIIRNVLALVRKRRNPVTWGEMGRVISNNPQLASLRAVGFFSLFPKGALLKIGQDICSWHSDLHREAREKGINFGYMVSGESFEVDEKKFLKFDKEPHGFLSNEDFQKLTSEGYIILTPEFTHYFPKIK